MPTLNNMEIPKPQYWKDFERLVESYARLTWPEGMTSIFGGVGQKQHGVDICVRYGRVNYIGLQCKNVAKLTYDQIEKEIEKAKNFKPALSHYLIATSINRKAELQEKVNVLNSQHNEKNLFSISILFWEDIIGTIMTNDEIFEKHYPQLSLKKSRGDSYSINATDNKNSIIGNIITINALKNPNIIKAPIQDTIGSNTYMKNYAKHLIDRYHEFKKAEINAGNGKMKYALIYSAIKREIGFSWDEIPYESFEDLCEYLQKRIDNTILGKSQKRSGIKNYSTYEEYMIGKQKKGFD